MTKYGETDNDAALKAKYGLYSIPYAAALWCGIPEENVQTILEEGSQLSQKGLGRCVWKHPTIFSLEVKSWAIAEAIEDHSLPHCREGGEVVEDNDRIPYSSRHVRARDLKKWLEKAFPDEKPAFLFTNLEKSSQSDMSTGTDVTNTNNSILLSSPYWNKLMNLAERSINEYPAWRRTVKKVQKTGNLHTWLIKTIGADTREAEILKKILSDFHDELN